MTRLIMPLLLIATAACATTNVSEVARTDLVKADGNAVGTVTVSLGSGPINVRVAARGLAPGRYGIHLHAVGRCEGPGFESAGPHWNPTTRQHGRLNSQGHHLGDLPNLEIGADGRGELSFAIAGTDMARDRQLLFDGDGASIVLHAAADDERTDPSGNSGARVACGVLTP